MEKRFSKAEANGKTVTLKVKGEMLEMMTMMPFMFFADARMEVHDVEVQMEEVEAIEIEAPPAIEEKK